MSPIVVEKTAGPKEPPWAAAQMAGCPSREGHRDTAGELPRLACLPRRPAWPLRTFGNFGYLAPGTQVSDGACRQEDGKEGGERGKGAVADSRLLEYSPSEQVKEVAAWPGGK